MIEAGLRYREERTLQDDVTLSDLVAVGRVTGCRYDQTIPDRLNATVLVEVEQTLRGSAQPGSTIRLRQFGGVASPTGGVYIAHNTIMCEVGARGLLFLSNAVYRVERAIVAGGESDPIHAPALSSYYVIRGDSYWSSDPGFAAHIAEAARAAAVLE